jgi:hypothetical protein
MLPTYRAILKGTRVIWLDAPPQLPEDAEVHITVLHPEASPPKDRDRGSAMAAALEKLSEINAFAGVDPIGWQRDVRQNRPLPGRED